MAATLAQLRAGLAARAATISGVNASAYMLPKPEPPAVCVLPAVPSTPAVFGTDDNVLFDLWVYTGSSDLVRAQELLDAYMDATGSSSLAAAVEALPGLGLSGVHTRVVGWSEYGRLMDVAGTQMFGTSMRVEVRR